jgi:hypothetical protein
VIKGGLRPPFLFEPAQAGFFVPEKSHHPSQRKLAFLCLKNLTDPARTHTHTHAILKLVMEFP